MPDPLRQIAEPFEAASDIGSVTLDVAVAYLAGWIFYYLTVWRPRAVNREKVLMHVSRDAVQVAQTANLFFEHLRFAANDDLPASPVDWMRVELAVRDLYPSANANMVTLSGAPVSLAGALDEAHLRQEQLAAKIERWTDFVSVDLLLLIHRLLDATILVQTIRSAVHLQKASFGGLSTEIIKWFEASDALRLYVATELAEDLRRAGYDPEGVAAGRIFLNRVPTT